MLFLNSNGTVKASQKISSFQGGLSASGVSLDGIDLFGVSVASVGDVDGDFVCVGRGMTTEEIPVLLNLRSVTGMSADGGARVLYGGKCIAFRMGRE